MVTDKGRAALAQAVRAAEMRVKASAVAGGGRGGVSRARKGAAADAYRAALDAHAAALEAYKAATGRDYWADCRHPHGNHGTEDEDTEAP